MGRPKTQICAIVLGIFFLNTQAHVAAAVANDPCCDPCAQQRSDLCDVGPYGPTCSETCNWWIAGTEATLLFADFDTVSGSPNAQTGGSFSASLADLNDEYGGARLWVGVQRGRWTIVGRYWELNGSENYFDPVFENNVPIFTTGVLAEQRFNLYAADLEALGSWNFYDVTMQFSFGARHAAIEHDSILTVNDLFNNDLLTGFVGEFQSFEGDGVTTAWGGRYPLSYFSNRFNLFWNFRSSVLWGETRNAVDTHASVISALGSAAQFDGASTQSNDELYIGEVQLGVQWNHQLSWRPATAFIRVAGEYQYWSVDGESTSALTTSGIPANSEVIAAANVDDLRLNLFGVTLGTGLMW